MKLTLLLLSQYLLTYVPNGVDVTKPTPEQKTALTAHVEYLETQHRSGRLLIGGRVLDPDAVAGLVVVEVAGEAEAQALVAEDPAVRAGVLKAKVQPFRTVWLPQCKPAEAAKSAR